MTATPSTFSFGPWLPDLGNNGLATDFGESLGVVPCADVQNVLWVNANWICTPGPVETAPALSDQSFGAFTWYDDNTGEEIVFAGLAEGIAGLINGGWTSLPFLNSQSSTVVQSWVAQTVFANFSPALPWKVKTKLATVTGTVTPNASASVVSARVNVGTQTGPYTFTGVVDVVGGTPTAWAWSIISGLGSISGPNTANPGISTTINSGGVQVGCTVTVGGVQIVATPGTYLAFNDD